MHLSRIRTPNPDLIPSLTPTLALTPTGGGGRYVWGIPHSHSKVLRIDTYNDTVAELSTALSGSRKWAGGVLYRNRVFGMPYDSSSVLLNTTLGLHQTLTCGTFTYGPHPGRPQPQPRPLPLHQATPASTQARC